ncbi:MAG: hypothetical protein E7382_02955 [Clostridiales bacterium]|nr:hypothetical protein [Clostridiales bacterium]
MGGLSLTVHPLFFVYGFYYALTGKIFTFIIFTVTAVAHEMGHSFVANGCGYKLNRITLMPFGAVVKGDIDGLKFSDEIKIAMAGPILNIAVALFFIALWWVFPEIYAYTELIVSANLSMATVNLLPVFPLDGGRILSAYTAMRLGQKRSERLCKITGGVLSLLLIALFLTTVFSGAVNLSLLFFSLFIFFGAFGKARENKYVKVYSAVTDQKLRRGIIVKRQAVDESVTLKKLLTVLDANALNEIEVYKKGKKVATLNDEKLKKIMENGDIYSPIGKFAV